MCHKATAWWALSLVTLGCTTVFAQTAPDWRKVGSSAVDLMLASPATGPVDQVWFSDDGAVLFARTRSGRIFQSSDFDTWVVSASHPEPRQPVGVHPVRLPEPDSRAVAASAGSSRVYALGRQLFRSEDGGHSWVNLTAYKSTPVIGGNQHSLAISPANRDHLVVANDFGVWRSLDGGLSWSGLNQFLPNLEVRRILSLPAGTAGARVLTGNMGVLELPAGGSIWMPSLAAPVDPDAIARSAYSAMVGADVSAMARAGDTVYIGSADGRLWVSLDGGATFRGPNPAPPGTSGRVERIYVDPAGPRVALAVLSGKGPRVLRTTYTGSLWDSIDGNLPDVAVRSIAAERASGAVYLATDKGVFWTQTDLENASANPVNWVNLTARLPQEAATDVQLDAAGVQLYAAIEGYGLYAVAAPHRTRNLRIVDAADFRLRAAAPGSLLAVVGSRVNLARGGGLTYPVLAASDTQSQIQVPFDAAGPNVALSLETPEGLVLRQLPVHPVSPAILLGRDGAPMLWDSETGLPIDLKNLAHSGGRIQVWATGLGRVRPDWPAGLPAPQDPPAVVAPIRAYLDRAPVAVTRATLVPGFIGFYLIELQLPQVLNAGASELYFTADNVESNHVQMVVEQ